MKKVLLLIGLWLHFSASFAQHPGFSKLYHYSGDTSATPDLINTLLYDSVSNKLFFHVTGASRSNTGYRIPSIFFRTGLSGNVEKEHWIPSLVETCFITTWLPALMVLTCIGADAGHPNLSGANQAFTY